jgi:DNA modification methylase
MKTTLQLELSHPQALPSAFQDDDVRYPESLVERFLCEYTQAGDTVLDPFAGYGTTLVVAERLGRIPYGIEINPEKVSYVCSLLAQPEHLLQGDARFLSEMSLPAIDFSMTSPPYTSLDDRDDPFTDYRTKSRGYAAYLRDLRSVYAQLRQLMKPSGIVVLEIANIKRNGRVTPLAWDVAHEISTVLRFEGEVVVCWDHYGYGYDHSYCLVYSAV